MNDWPIFSRCSPDSPLIVRSRLGGGDGAKYIINMMFCQFDESRGFGIINSMSAKSPERHLGGSASGGKYPKTVGGSKGLNIYRQL